MQQRRWVSYIYRYRQNERCEIAGFVKIQRITSRRSDQARIRMGLKMYKGYPCGCTAYLVRAGQAYAFATIPFEARERDTLLHSVELPWEDPLNQGISFTEYEGVYFRCDDGEELAGMWVEDTFSMEAIQVEEEKEAVATEEISKPVSCEDFLKQYPKLPILPGSQILDGVKIVPQDIGRLTPEIWKLGVNSFLSHGYYKYRYLMFGRVHFLRGESFVIGVPGVYTNKEKYLANMFGFHVFVPMKKVKMNTGNFGFWVYEVPDEPPKQIDYIASGLHTAP